MPDQTEDQQSLIDAFNRAHPIGTPVRYWTGDREGDGKTSTTRTAAQLLSGHTAVVWVEGEASCIALTHVEPLPDQPDGIEDDSLALPNPAVAATRVSDYIRATGDGLYDIQSGAPLYARDLEALTRAPAKLADLQEELSRRTHTLDLVRRELGATRAEADHAIPNLRRAAAQIHAIRALVEPHREPHATTPVRLTELAINILTILDGGTAPVPGSSRRAQEPEPACICGHASGAHRAIPAELGPVGVGRRCSMCFGCNAYRPAGESPASEPDGYLIWSHHHKAWFAPNGCGYRSQITDAGRFALGATKQWLGRGCGCCLVPEVVIPAPGTEVLTTPGMAGRWASEQIEAATKVRVEAGEVNSWTAAEPAAPKLAHGGGGGWEDDLPYHVLAPSPIETVHLPAEDVV